MIPIGGTLFPGRLKLDFWKIASDNKNYIIEDTGNFIEHV